MVKRLTEIHRMLFRNSCFVLVLLLVPIAIFSQTLPVDPTSPDTQNATRAPSTEKKPGQKPAAPTPEPSRLLKTQEL